MGIVIKKRVSFEFLGDDYKDAYITFRAIPAIDFEDIMTRLKALEGKNEGSLGLLIEILSKYFVEGQFPNDGKQEPVEAADIGQLDAASIIECFKFFTGQQLDPKVSTPLTSSLPTAEVPPTNS